MEQRVSRFQDMVLRVQVHNPVATLMSRFMLYLTCWSLI